MPVPSGREWQLAPFVQSCRSAALAGLGWVLPLGLGGGELPQVPVARPHPAAVAPAASRRELAPQPPGGVLWLASLQALQVAGTAALLAEPPGQRRLQQELGRVHAAAAAAAVEGGQPQLLAPQLALPAELQATQHPQQQQAWQQQRQRAPLLMQPQRPDAHAGTEHAPRPPGGSQWPG